MKKPNTFLDFHLDCNCFLRLQNTLRAAGRVIQGVNLFEDRWGNSGIVMFVLIRRDNPLHLIPPEEIKFNYCPFCGSRIAVQFMGGGNVGTVRKTELAP